MRFVAAVTFAARHLFPVTPQSRELRADREDLSHLLADLASRLPDDIVAELAIPSYRHRNPLMRFLVWERLACALEWLDRLPEPPRVVLDFGCGLGPLFRSFVRRGFHVIACDLHTDVARAGARWAGIENIDVVDAASGLGSLPDECVDAALALEVLEHVEDVSALGSNFGRVLAPGGRLLCSLPTENLLYRAGRRLAGFSGHYHVRRSADIISALAKNLATRRVARLYPALPLYDFFECLRREAG